jgi:hypothetical protein
MIRRPVSRTVSQDAIRRPEPKEGNPMTILRSTRTRIVTMTVGLAAAAVPVLSQTASAADQSCKFILNSVKAVDVQETGTRGDEIFIKLDGQRFPSSGFVRFGANGASAAASLFQNAAVDFADDNPLSVQLIEHDPLFNDQIGNAKSLECTGGQTDQVLVFKETGVKYLMTYDVDLFT